MTKTETPAEKAAANAKTRCAIVALIGAPIFAWLLYRTQLKGWNND